MKNENGVSFDLMILPFVAFGAVSVFVLAPSMRFADPVWVTLAGLGLATGLAGMFARRAVPPKPFGLIAAPYLLLLSGVGCGIVIDSALRTSVINDQRCAAIQRMMLAPNPIRSDGPDLFQALGCRPQNLPFTEWPTKVKRKPVGD